jgi:hypothetical protein
MKVTSISERVGGFITIPIIRTTPFVKNIDRASQSSNQGAKRYVLTNSPDSNMTHVMHGCGPSSIAEQTTIPIRTAAECEANNPSGETNPSSQV